MELVAHDKANDELKISLATTKLKEMCEKTTEAMPKRNWHQLLRDRKNWSEMRILNLSQNIALVWG